MMSGVSGDGGECRILTVAGVPISNPDGSQYFVGTTITRVLRLTHPR